MASKLVRQVGWNALSPRSEHADWGAVVPATRLADQLAQRVATLIDRGEFAEGTAADVIRRAREAMKQEPNG